MVNGKVEFTVTHVTLLTNNNLLTYGNLAFTLFHFSVQRTLYTYADNSEHLKISLIVTVKMILYINNKI